MPPGASPAVQSGAERCDPIVQHDTPMQVALSRAFHWQWLLEQGLAKSGAEIAQQEGLPPGASCC